MKISAILIPLIIFLSCNTRKGSDIMPNAQLLLVDSSEHHLYDLVNPKLNSLIIYFSPDCEHCQRETGKIIKNIAMLKDFNIIFVTIDPFQRLKVFKKYYNINLYPNIHLGQDYKFSISNFYHYPTPPLTAVFDDQKRLRFIFRGEPNESQFFNALKEL